MNGQIPWGQREDLRQEFLGREALSRAEGIGREVVSMLNAEGGAVWVGLREEKGRAVAVEAIPNAESERLRLRDFLFDTIEPMPIEGEVRVEVQVADDGEQVLCVHVAPWSSRRPYAHLEKGGRFFVIRVGDRSRPMAREEMFREHGLIRDQADGGIEGAVRKLLQERGELQKAGGRAFWLALRPVRTLDLVLDEELSDALLVPRLVGNRATGWRFRQVDARRDGTLVFRVMLESLFWQGEKQEIWPTALLEYPVSACRIARHVYERFLDEGDVLAADLALIGARGWKLRPGSPNIITRRSPAAVFDAAADLLLERPLVFTYGELAAQPDRCGYRLVERVYEAFGYRRDAIPRDFDAKIGRLVLPE